MGSCSMASSAHRVRAPLPTPSTRSLCAFGGTGAAVGALAYVASHAALISDDGMAPSLLPGDLVLLWRVAPEVGDVVAVLDPLDPTSWTLRRVEAIGGAIEYSSGSYMHDIEPVLLDMGMDDAGFSVIQEGHHLTRHKARNVSYSVKVSGVPDDSAWLGADNRDQALDSRWWGPVPLDLLQGKVMVRLGAPRNRWRSWIDLDP